jgi:hypothetical protein
MSVTNPAAIPPKHFHVPNRLKQFNIPIYHILILAWYALFILYGLGI